MAAPSTALTGTIPGSQWPAAVPQATARIAAQLIAWMSAQGCWR